MSLADPSPERVSACPVHFLWDGRGHGRSLVRAGFLGFLIAALLACAWKVMHFELLQSSALVVFAVAGAVYALGQLWSFAVARRLIA
ncbi:MAG TPA: hypothetical protein VGO62_08870 [Myxococcota bacterium]|jgi:hypothetical protein